MKVTGPGSACGAQPGTGTMAASASSLPRTDLPAPQPSTASHDRNDGPAVLGIVKHAEGCQSITHRHRLPVTVGSTQCNRGRPRPATPPRGMTSSG